MKMRRLASRAAVAFTLAMMAGAAYAGDPSGLPIIGVPVDKAIGFQPAAFTVLFAVPRTIGWLSHYDELMSSDFKITRPAQIYIGSGERPVPADRG